MVGHLAQTSVGVADVGADHAHLAVAMVRADRAARAVAIDVVPELVATAARYVARCRCDRRVQVRLGDGLTPLSPGEVDTVALAGIGGRLACRILMPERLAELGIRRVVVQPNRDDVAVRAHLSASGWPLTEETLVHDAGRLFYTLVATPGSPTRLDPIDLWLGPILRHRSDELSKAFRRIRADWLRQKPSPRTPEIDQVLAHIAR